MPPAELFCATCDALQPPVARDHFQRLELSRSYELDPRELDRHYFRYQRLLHPDRFATKSVRERAFSLGHATDINDAYETLRDPLRRAEYLLSLVGRTVNAGSQTIDDHEMLTESIERREALAEARSPREVDAIMSAALSDIQTCQTGISTAFAEDDVDTAATLTTRLKYLQKLAGEARTVRARFPARSAMAITGE